MSTQGDGMADVTEADREKAAALINHTYCDAEACECSSEDEVDAIAAALAEERQKARVPFLALAATWERRADAYAESGEGDYARELRQRAAAIRRAAEQG